MGSCERVSLELGRCTPFCAELSDLPSSAQNGSPPSPGAWSRLRAICGLSPPPTAPGSGVHPGHPQLQSHGWRVKCCQLHCETPPKSGGNFLRGGVVQTGTICSWPICAPVGSLVSYYLTNSLRLLIPLLHRLPPWPGHSASHGQWGGSPEAHALARGMRDKPLGPPAPSHGLKTGSPLLQFRVLEFSSIQRISMKHHAGPHLEGALPSSLWLAQVAGV